MADELSPQAACDRLRSHLHRMPEGMDLQKQAMPGPIDANDPQVVESIRVWLDELNGLLQVCGVWIKNSVAGRGLESLWLRKLAEHVAQVEEARRNAYDLADYLFRNDHLGLAIQPFAQAGYYIAKYRGKPSPCAIAGLLEEDQPDALSWLRSLAEEFEQRWIDSGLPPRHNAGGSLHKVTPHTPAQNELEGSIAEFERDCGAALMQTIDELMIPDELRNSPEFVDMFVHQLRHGAIDGRGVFQWLCVHWLPTQREGYGGVTYDYPGAGDDDQQRFNLGVRRARCVAALADALAPRSAHTDELLQMAKEAEAKRARRTEATKRGNERYEVFSRYDTVWLDKQRAPCNPVADEPLDPGWLLERLTTLVTRARALDEFDGSTFQIDRLKWLRDSPLASENDIARAFAIAIDAAVDGKLNHHAATAVCALLEEHPGNELRALYRAKPVKDVNPPVSVSHPRPEPAAMETTTQPQAARDVNTDATLLVKSLRRVRERFASGANNAAIVGVMVHHSHPVQRPQPRWPNSQVQSLTKLSTYLGMTSELVQLRTREDFDAVADRPFLDKDGKPIVNSVGQPIPLLPEWQREIAVYSESPELREACRLSAFEAAAAEAGSLVRGLPQAMKNVVWADWKTAVMLPEDKELWMSAVFELAWQKHPGSGLNADRLAWLENHSMPIAMLEQVVAGKLRPAGTEQIVDAAGHPAAYWYSQIPNLWQASLAAIDLLVTLLQQAAEPEASGKAGGDLIERLLAGPDDVELSPREMALLEAHLKQPVSLSTIQREKAETGESATAAKRNKLKLIRDFNHNLQRESSEAASGSPVPETPADVTNGEQKATQPYDVDEDLAQIRIDGAVHDVPNEAARMAKLLLDRMPEAVAMSKEGFTKPSATKKQLPEAVQALIETGSGKGYRLRRAD